MRLYAIGQEVMIILSCVKMASQEVRRCRPQQMNTA